MAKAYLFNNQVAKSKKSKASLRSQVASLLKIHSSEIVSITKEGSFYGASLFNIQTTKGTYLVSKERGSLEIL